MGAMYELWPGVVAIKADADMYCVECAKVVYGSEPIMAIVHGVKGYQHFTDHEGNPFGVILRMSEDLHTQYCGTCHIPLCEDGACWCYQAPHGQWWDVPLDGRV